MKNLVLLFTFACALATPAALRADDAKPAEKPAAPAQQGKFKWYTTYSSAKKAAAEQKLPILALFTGSDWCPWCIKLEKEILSKKEFKDWAPSHVILFIADAKGGPDKLSAENAKLMRGYGAHGFPTVVLTDATGKAIDKTGYQKLSPAEYCKHLEGLLGKN